MSSKKLLELFLTKSLMFLLLGDSSRLLKFRISCVTDFSKCYIDLGTLSWLSSKQSLMLCTSKLDTHFWMSMALLSMFTFWLIFECLDSTDPFSTLIRSFYEISSIIC